MHSRGGNPPPAEALQRAVTAWKSFGAPSDAGCIESLSLMQPFLMDIGGRIQPLSFDGNDLGAPLLVRHSHPWSSLSNTLRRWHIRGLIYHLPVFWQCESRAFDACQASGAFIAQNDARNLPVARRMMTEAGADAVIAESADIASLLAFLPHEERKLLSCIAIHRITDSTWMTLPASDDAMRIAQEVHLMPGVPALTQCEALADLRSHLFHIEEGFYWEYEDGTLMLTDAQNEPLPLVRYPVNGIARSHICPCGKETFTRAITEAA